MKTVLADTGIESDEGALKVIAQAASGGMRDALSMLDQVVSFSGDKLTVEDALLVTGSIGEDIFLSIGGGITWQRCRYGTYRYLIDLLRRGKMFPGLAEDLITFFRDLLLLRTAPDLKDLLELVSGDSRFVEMAKHSNRILLYSFIDILAKTQQEMRFSNHAKVYIESALLKMIHFEATRSTSWSIIRQPIQALAQKVTDLERTY